MSSSSFGFSLFPFFSSFSSSSFAFFSFSFSSSSFVFLSCSSPFSTCASSYSEEGSSSMFSSSWELLDGDGSSLFWFGEAG